MLGIGKPKTNFELAAYGKHPAFNDFFSINTDSPLTRALSAWVEKGAKLNENKDRKRQIRSFRFWVRGIKKGDLVLGIIRDSSDRMGRLYPLLVLAKGFVQGWEKNWNYMFNRFETVFRSLEDFTAARYENFREFETKLTQIRIPELLCTNHPGVEIEKGSILPEKMIAWFEKNGGKGALALPIATLLNNFESFPRKHDRTWHGLFKPTPQGPGAVFQGGLPDNPILTIYARPLKTEDFFDLFNLSNGNETMGDVILNKGDTADGY